jgi:photosynthetic reaction center cytochrome c subunit
MAKVLTAALLVMFSFACGKKKDSESGPAPPQPPPAATDAAAPPPRPVDAAAAAAADAAPPPVDAGAAAGPDAGPTADKNQGPPRDLQVLPRKWPRDKVKAWMKDNMERGLGAKCKFCHDESDFAADHEHKAEARDMIRMTFDLDRTYFKGKGRITCFTCHAGKLKVPGAK